MIVLFFFSLKRIQNIFQRETFNHFSDHSNRYIVIMLILKKNEKILQSRLGIQSMKMDGKNILKEMY